MYECVYVYTCIDTCTHTHAHIRTIIYIYICACAWVRVCTCVFVCVWMCSVCICVYVFAHLCVYVCSCVCTCTCERINIHVFIHSPCTCEWINIHVFIHSHLHQQQSPRAGANTQWYFAMSSCWAHLSPFLHSTNTCINNASTPITSKEEQSEITQELQEIHTCRTVRIKQQKMKYHPNTTASWIKFVSTVFWLSVLGCVRHLFLHHCLLLSYLSTDSLRIPDTCTPNVISTLKQCIFHTHAGILSQKSVDKAYRDGVCIVYLCRVRQYVKEYGSARALCACASRRHLKCESKRLWESASSRAHARECARGVCVRENVRVREEKIQRARARGKAGRDDVESENDSERESERAREREGKRRIERDWHTEKKTDRESVCVPDLVHTKNSAMDKPIHIWLPVWHLYMSSVFVHMCICTFVCMCDGRYVCACVCKRKLARKSEKISVCACVPSRAQREREKERERWKAWSSTRKKSERKIKREMYMRVCTCVRECLCACTCVRARERQYSYVYVCSCMRVCARVRACACVCLRARACACVCAWVCVCMCACVCVLVCVHSLRHANTNTQIQKCRLTVCMHKPGLQVATPPQQG